MNRLQGWVRARSGYVSLVDKYSAALEEHIFGTTKPFIACYVEDDRRLDFVACDHETDPHGSTFRLIDGLFTIAPPRWVIVEGFSTSRGPNPNPIIALVAKQSGRDSWATGEGAHAVRQCLKGGITFEGGEPEELDTFAALCENGFRQVDIANSTLVAALVQDRTDDNSLSSSLPTSRQIAQWHALLSKNLPQAARDFPSLDNWWQDCFGMPLAADPEWYRRVDPGGTGRGSEVMQELNLHRDRHLYRLILQRSAEEDHLAVIFGGSHLATLWRSLSAAFGEPRLKKPLEFDDIALTRSW